MKTFKVFKVKAKINCRDLFSVGDEMILKSVPDAKGYFDYYTITLVNGNVYPESTIRNMIGPKDLQTLFTKLEEI